MVNEDSIPESLVLIRNGDDVLLGLKKDREGKIVFGKYKWNGFGGKIAPIDNGSIEACAARETFEESGIMVPPEKLVQVGCTHYSFEGSSEPDHIVTVFEYWSPDRDYDESAEMMPRWFSIKKKEIPYDANKKSEECDMWHNDRFWMPLVLEKGETFNARIIMDENYKTVSCVINDKEYIQ